VAFALAIDRVGRPMVVPASSIPEYGSDADGLVWGYLFAPGQRPKPIACADAVSALAASRPGEFLWLHFNLANAAAAGWMKRHLDLPESFHEGMNADIASTRLEQEDGVYASTNLAAHARQEICEARKKGCFFDAREESVEGAMRRLEDGVC
jgi:hypothetical protein